MRVLYLDAPCGVAGDMFLGALVDAGCPLAEITKILKQLPIADEFDITAKRVLRGALMGTHIQVTVHPNHSHGDHHHSHGRHFSEISEMLHKSELPPRAKSDADSVFRLLGEVEAHLHGYSLEEVHFHEVGAVDSIVDIVGSCVALSLLGIERVYSSPLTDGMGTLVAAHGVMPIPAPATLELLKNVPLLSCDIPSELITPTGAALLKHFCVHFGQRPAMTVQAVGYGAGTKEFPQRPNLLRAIIGDVTEIQAG